VTSRRLAVAVALAAAGLAPAALAAPVGVAPVKFSFTVARPGRTSAGVYSRAGALVKTLWSGVALGAGRHERTWDGSDDADAGVATGPYEIRVVTSGARYTWDGVVGNTSDPPSGPTVFHFMSTVSGLAVAGDAAFIAVGYNEGYSSQARFSTRDPTKKVSILGKGAQFWKVATDGERVFWAGDDPNVADDGFVVATRVSDDGQVAFDARHARRHPMRYGMAYDGAIDLVRGAGAEPSGLAVQRRGRFLFVSHRGMNVVHVLDKRTGQLVSKVAREAPGDLAVDARDDLWMIEGAPGARVVRRAAVREDGALVPGAALAGLARPLALAASELVLVVDGGDRQQVRAFDRDGRPAWTLGRAGGYARDPVVAVDKFDFEADLPYVGGPFVAAALDGSFWVGDPGCARVERFAADRTPLGQVAYLPTTYAVTADPNAPGRVFAGYLELAVDDARPFAPGSWRLARNWRVGVPRGLGSIYQRLKDVSTLANGRTYAALDGALFELPPAGPLRRSASALVVDGVPATLHADGSLRAVKIDHGIQTWVARRLDGFDGEDPVWGSPFVVARAPLDAAAPHDVFDPNVMPAGIQTAGGVVLSYDGAVPLGESPVHAGYHLGGVATSGERWLWRAAPSTPRRYSGAWPDDGAFDVGNAVGNAGGPVLATGRHVFVSYRGEGWKGLQTNKWRHFLDDGLFVDEFGPLGTDDEAAPGMAGNVMSARLVRLEDGRALIYHNDESRHGGVHRWRVEDLDRVVEQSIAVTLRRGRATAAARGSKDVVEVDLLAGLPPEAVVVDGVAGWRVEPPPQATSEAAWSVRTNLKTWQRTPPVDLDVRFADATPGARASVSHALPATKAPLRRWCLDARVDYEGNFINHGETGGQRLDVLDGAGKIIARFYPTLVAYPGDGRVYGNREVVVRVGHYLEIQAGLAGWQPLRIAAEDGRVTFSYAGRAPVTAAPFDADADWRRPRSLRLSFWNDSAPYPRACALDDLTFRGSSR
jgi:hypothetical protein